MNNEPDLRAVRLSALQRSNYLRWLARMLDDGGPIHREILRAAVEELRRLAEQEAEAGA